MRARSAAKAWSASCWCSAIASWRLLKLDLFDADIAGCDFRDAHKKPARFKVAYLREERLGGLKRLDAKLFKGATISHRQAAELVAEPGLNVA